ncbi:monocarboxylate transporter 13 [Strongylocentrotus purpuratus]|uniref:Major facilitator superfamily (MFS) profile domain-containing protein n=1 Tax=Strongylocentrotus purpuratus TaxID=7668 RepID=A0A7M7PKV3_STRPU|nr:monocarboxylate transporter 13 [Strongylocentrotus purpuratus]
MTNKSDSVDGGWAWCVLLATFTNQLLYAGAVPLVGIYLVEWQEYFGVGAGSLSFIATELTLGLPAIGFLAGALCQRFGCRLVMIFGGVIGMISTFFASFSTQLWHLHIYSTLAGVFYGAAYFPSAIVIRFYFKKRLGFANGITYAGVGAGFFVMSPLLETLCSEYGWKGALMIQSAINANFIALGVILRRTNMEQTIMTAYRSKPLTASHQVSDANDLSRAESLCKRILRNIDETFAISHLVKNAYFITLCLVSILSFASHISVLIYTAPKLVGDLGLSKTTASLVMSVYGISSLLARVLHGFLLDFKWISTTNLYILSLLIAGIQPLFNPLVTSTAGQFALIVVYGIGAGMMIPMTMLVCRKYVAINIVSSAIGLLITVGGVGNILGTQLMGQLSDATGSYAVPFYVCGSFYWLSAIAMALITKCKRFKDGNQHDIAGAIPDVAATQTDFDDIPKDTSKATTGTGYHQVPGDIQEGSDNWESAV